MKPEYRVRIEIYDDNVGEVVARVDDPMYSNAADNASGVFRAFRHFEGDAKLKHEMTHYPDSQGDNEEA